jgi:cell fate regulator YaaT (PSP1 superfamily)
MCCLKYEQETYEALGKGLPSAGDWVRTEAGPGEVLSVNILRQLVQVAVKTNKNDETAVDFYEAGKVSPLPHGGSACPAANGEAHCGKHERPANERPAAKRKRE